MMLGVVFLPSGSDFEMETHGTGVGALAEH